MLLINKLTKPGTIKRIELRPDTVRVVTVDGRERLYEVLPTFRGQTGYGCPDTDTSEKGGLDQ